MEGNAAKGASTQSRRVLAASLALLGFTLVTTVALVAWFARVDDPLQWQA